MSTRLRYVMLALHGHRTETDQAYRRHAELTRLQTVELLNIQLDKKNKIKQAANLWPFPWDDEPTAPDMPTVTPEQAKEQLTKLLDLVNKSHEQHSVNA
jgi:hypothetical protein